MGAAAVSESVESVLREAQSLGMLFEGLAARHADAPAVADGATELSYADLDARANGVRDELLRRGVAPRAHVGICLDRSADAAVAVLGILKAGAAYVPLDPAYPSERLRFIAEDAGIHTVVGDPDTAAGLDLADVSIVPAGSAAATATGGASPASATSVNRDDPAYVIYTSGSTGKPKGVVVTHGNVLELLEGTRELFDFHAGDRWSVFHSFNFDFSVWELWAPFVDGACTVIVPDTVVKSPPAFARFLSEQRITVLNQIPSVFRYTVLAWEHEDRPPLAVRHVIFGGDAVDLVTVARFAEATDEHRPAFTNMYGITEITVHATFKRLGEEDWSEPSGSPIGRALPHLEIAVLDEDGNPVGDGEIGEMWISGGGVAGGYLNRPDLTRERFPTRAVDGAERRFYRSGDLARVRPDGELDFAGRNDQQVKVRGFRIEPGEIEAVLRGHEAVRDAAVVVTAGAADNVLTAVVSPDGPVDDLAAALRAHCEERLPAHMVPSRIRLVDEMPSTPSGKLDRRAVAAQLTAQSAA